MKQISYILSFLFFAFFMQTCSKKKVTQVFGDGKTIPVIFDPDKISPLDSFLSKITVVPLETNDDCLIGSHIFQVKVHQDLVYINSFMQKLLVFDLKGNFIREIGKRGEGPGEFREVRDFIFTNAGTIELLDFLKIESYTIDGSYTGITKRFNFLGENFFCNPDNFCKSFSSGYYFWGGTTGLSNEKLREKSSLMYQIDSNMKIERGYFCTKYGCGGTMDRFKYYQDKVLVIPSAFDYNVYQIDSNDSISIRYKFDFGKFEFDSNKDVDRKLISYNEYVYSLGHLHETDRFLYFTFQYDKFFYYMLYFKETGQSYFQTSSASVIGNDFTFVPIQAIHKDRLISVVDMYAFLFYLERMSEDNRNKWGLNEYKKLDPEDNPVLIFYTPKN